MPDDRQSAYLLQNYYYRHKVLPSFAGIGKLVGLSSKASVADLVLRLKHEKLLDAAPNGRLRPGKRFFQRPIVESVQAGMPIDAPDTPPELMGIDDYLVNNPARTVLIRVRGESMIDAGIHPGDSVVVEKRSNAVVGDIVVAIVDNEFTLKRLAREKGRPVLRPENKSFPVIRPRGELEIFGVVVGQFRKYR
jgi:SOS regulatory protein LexA